MDDRERLAERFEEHGTAPEGGRLPTLGSPGEAADAVQEAWLGLGRTERSGHHWPAGGLARNEATGIRRRVPVLVDRLDQFAIGDVVDQEEVSEPKRLNPAVAGVPFVAGGPIRSYGATSVSRLNGS